MLCLYTCVGSGVKIPDSPEVFEPSANKKPALNQNDCDSETGLSTPLFHSYKLRKKKRRHSILHRKKKPQMGTYIHIYIIIYISRFRSL